MKLKTLLVTWSMFLFCFAFTSCDSVLPMNKDRYLAQYESFIEEVTTNYRDYDKETWKGKDLAFKKYARELYREYEAEMTDEEIEKTLTLRVSYNALKIKGKAGNFLDNVENELHDLLND